MRKDFVAGTAKFAIINSADNFCHQVYSVHASLQNGQKISKFRRKPRKKAKDAEPALTQNGTLIALTTTRPDCREIYIC